MNKNNDNKLVFLPLAGTGEIGMNMNLYGYGPEIDEMKWLPSLLKFARMTT